MTPADFAWPDDDLRARLEMAEATNHVLTELIYEPVQRNPVNARSILGGTE